MLLLRMFHKYKCHLSIGLGLLLAVAVVSNSFMSFLRLFGIRLFSVMASESYSAGTHSVALVTAPTEEVAKSIARGLVMNKLAACVNIIPKITSIYEWKGEMNEDSEILLIIKTRSSRLEELTKFVKENHPYEVCEVISLPIAQGNVPYLNWIGQMVPEKPAS